MGGPNSMGGCMFPKNLIIWGGVNSMGGYRERGTGNNVGGYCNVGGYSCIVANNIPPHTINCIVANNIPPHTIKFYITLFCKNTRTLK